MTTLFLKSKSWLTSNLKKKKKAECVNVLNKDAEKMYIEAEEKVSASSQNKNSSRKTVLDKQIILKDPDESITRMKQSKKD